MIYSGTMKGSKLAWLFSFRENPQFHCFASQQDTWKQLHSNCSDFCLLVLVWGWSAPLIVTDWEMFVSWWTRGIYNVKSSLLFSFCIYQYQFTSKNNPVVRINVCNVHSANHRYVSFWSIFHLFHKELLITHDWAYPVTSTQTWLKCPVFQ